ncbi:DUF3617 domain-containing protein [Hyphococcus sp.]|jgi:hypothetical protein|uniref:DUF3617 domain-containing protein n=1 Tax=Hyphococcus sp. TaxID=2038636 RepID=UPI003D115576
MKSHSTSVRLLFGALLLVAAQACSETSDPASEAPVDPKPGLYEIAISGAGLLKNVESNKAPKTYCLTEIQAASFPHMLAENYYKLSPLCTVQRGQREGNLIAGEISCAADPKMASGSNRFLYEGSVGEEKTTVNVRMKLDAEVKPGAGGAEVSDAQLKMAMKAMERMRFVIDAVRTGDCG